MSLPTVLSYELSLDGADEAPPPFVIKNVRGRLVAEEQVRLSQGVPQRRSLGFLATIHENGKVRVDHTDYLSFWLEFELPDGVLAAVEDMLPLEVKARGRVATRVVGDPFFEAAVPFGHNKRDNRPLFEKAYAVDIFGRLRIDSLRHPEFWLELDLSNIVDAYMAALYRPDGPLVQGVMQERYPDGLLPE